MLTFKVVSSDPETVFLVLFSMVWLFSIFFISSFMLIFGRINRLLAKISKEKFNTKG